LALYRTGDLTDLAEAVHETLEALQPSAVGFDPWTTEALAEALTISGQPMVPVTGRAWVSACQTLLELIQTDRLRHPGREALAAQLSYAGRRESTEGRWWITRGAEPIPAVTATARAVYLAARPRPVYAIH
jgi:phage terminase large subunit-like protein